MICTVGQKPALHTLLSLYASVSDFLRPFRAEKLLALFYIDNNANGRKECYGTDFCVWARHERPRTQRKPVQTKLCMAEIGLNHKPKRKPNAITKADREASKSDDLIKRDFAAEKPLEKCMTDMTEIKASDGKLYVSAIFDCYDLAVLGLAMDTNMRATLCEQTLENACKAYPMLRGAILHSDRGTQYTSELYRKAINRYGIVQSMNSAGGRCHDNARCESMWARFKEELLYGRYDPTAMTVEQLKTLIWRYFISYWNNRRICSANGGLPPMVKRQQYYASLQEAA